MKTTRHRPDFILFVVIVLLVLFGLVNIYSASTIVSLQIYGDTDAVFMRQLLWVFVGLFLMLFFMNFTYTRWQKLSKLLLPLSYLLLVMVFLPEPIGVLINGAHRWVNLGIQFQPSDLAMFSIIVYLAYLLTRKQERILDPRASFWPPMVLIAAGFGLIMLEPDMDTAVTYAACPFLLMFVAGVPFKYLRNTFIVGVAALVPLVFVGYRAARIKSYLDPWNSVEHYGYQIIQSLYAISTGGWTGRGLGHSIEKFSYLPEPHTDFIFAVLSEEWGFIGGAFLIVLYCILIWRGLQIATRVRDRFASLLAVGITANVGIAVFLNIGSVTNLLPVIGVPLPFISYGGTSLLVKLVAMGILLNVSRYTEQQAITEDKAPMRPQRPVAVPGPGAK
ncbi:MAG TPA: putative lipid II flippase FtsW [Bacilli bacterium]|nr:putative lipid II flippase FtsW [Bacilli bacterium]